MMAGLGRLMNADTVTVVDDGGDGGPAIVRAEGWEAPLDLLIGHQLRIRRIEE